MATLLGEIAYWLPRLRVRAYQPFPSSHSHRDIVWWEARVYVGHWMTGEVGPFPWGLPGAVGKAAWRMARTLVAGRLI